MNLNGIVIQDELPLLVGINKMKEHHRIIAFHNHGAFCSKCGKQAKRFIKHHGNHWDVFDDDGYLMSCRKADMKPYCHRCINELQFGGEQRFRNELVEVIIANWIADFGAIPNKNDFVCRIGFAVKHWGHGKSKITGGFNNGHYYDKVIKVCKNPATLRNAVMLEHSLKESYYNLDSVCKIVPRQIQVVNSTGTDWYTSHIGDYFNIEKVSESGESYHVLFNDKIEYIKKEHVRHIIPTSC